MKRALFAAAAVAAMAGILGTVLAPIAAAQQPTQEELVTGWYRDREVKYYDFGDNTKLAQGSAVQTAPIFVFIYGMNADGTPEMVQGQHNIVDLVPGETGYSDLWQVTFVTVPRAYVADSVKSVADITAQGYALTQTDMFVNCPIVPAGTTLEDGEQLVQGWHDGEEVFYPDFGANPAVAIPIWVFVTGFDAQGNPQMVEGQRNIIDAVPGDAGYSAFWRVNFVTVPEGYQANTIRSAEAAIDSGYPVKQADVVVNCPVTTVAAAATQPGATGGQQPTSAPRTGTGDAGDGGDGSDGSDVALYATLAGVAALLLGAASTTGAVILRRRSR
ncbi:MAG TPA: hypothetical protein VJP07_10385 [Dehalococcoidia bacterium]|nr:hypothetical protein [Dehalococcoidia bacterium]